MTDNLKSALNDLKRSLTDIADTARRDAETGDDSINIAGRSNIAVASNVGQDGSTHSVSTTQKMRIRQNGGETIEETETTKRTS